MESGSSKNPDDYAVVEPISEDFSSAIYSQGEYDPRPDYIKRNGPHSFEHADPGTRQVSKSFSRKSSYPTSNDEIHFCTVCGGELTYIANIKSWYCYDCKKYVSVSNSGIPSQTSSTEPSKPTPPGPVRPITQSKDAIEPEYIEDVKPPQKPKKGNWRPLKEYERYND